jgi:hypothetical protein
MRLYTMSVLVTARQMHELAKVFAREVLCCVGAFLQLKPEECCGCAIREAHAVAVDITDTWSDDFHHHSAPISMHSGDDDYDWIA